MRRIILIGYMGSGKTTVGKALSKETGMMFYDLDWYIESRMRKTVSQIFAEKGGTPCFFDNMDYLNQQGDVVYLKATPETLYKHLLMAKVERPLLKDKTPEELIAYITEHLKEREPFYGKARHILDVNVLDNYDKIAISVERIKSLLSL